MPDCRNRSPHGGIGDRRSWMEEKTAPGAFAARRAERSLTGRARPGGLSPRPRSRTLRGQPPRRTRRNERPLRRRVARATGRPPPAREECAQSASRTAGGRAGTACAGAVEQRCHELLSRVRAAPRKALRFARPRSTMTESELLLTCRRLSREAHFGCEPARNREGAHGRHRRN